MKKRIILVAVFSILLASCGGSSWSCKKSYCDAKKVNVNMTENEVMFPKEVTSTKP